MLSILAIWCWSSSASTAKCYNHDRAEFYIRAFRVQTSKFKIYRNGCGYKGELIPLFETFDFLANLKFSDSAFRPTSTSILDTNYYKFVQSRIERITKEVHSEADAGMNPENGELAIGEAFLKNKNVVERAAILIHEAHHRTPIKNGYSHVKCRSGEFKNSYDCDPSFKFAGSYAVEVEFLARLYHEALDITPEQRDLARRAAVEILNTNFVIRDISF